MKAMTAARMSLSAGSFVVPAAAEYGWASFSLTV